MTKYVIAFLLLATPAHAWFAPQWDQSKVRVDPRIHALAKCFQDFTGAERDRCVAGVPR